MVLRALLTGAVLSKGYDKHDWFDSFNGICLASSPLQRELVCRTTLTKHVMRGAKCCRAFSKALTAARWRISCSILAYRRLNFCSLISPLLMARADGGRG